MGAGDSKCQCECREEMTWGFHRSTVLKVVLLMVTVQAVVMAAIVVYKWCQKRRRSKASIEKGGEGKVEPWKPPGSFHHCSTNDLGSTNWCDHKNRKPLGTTQQSQRASGTVAKKQSVNKPETFYVKC